MDISETIKADMIRVMRLLEMLLRKSSTPGDRATVKRELPEVWCRLELALPMYFQTMVAHYCVHHAVEHIEATGPFHVANMLDMERFQTVLKGCAKAKKHVMQSIVNNYLLLEVALDMRLCSFFDWTVRPSGSSTAAYLQKVDGANKMDRMYTVTGKKASYQLGAALFKCLLKLWRTHNADYDALVKRFEKDQREHRKHSGSKGGRSTRQSRLVASIAEWKPKRRLTQEEQRWASMVPQVTVSFNVLVKHTYYSFYDRTNTNRNTCTALVNRVHKTSAPITSALITSDLITYT